MGAHAARKAERVVDHVATVLAVEVLAAAQALDTLRPLTAGRGVEAARRAFRRRVSRMREDRVLAGDIASARLAVDDRSLRTAAERVTGPLR
jgi:histidine ammonia-lyase